MQYTKIDLPYKVKSGILGLGAQSKSSLCFIKDRTAYLFSMGGDLDNPDELELFKKYIVRLKRQFKIKVKILACDLHPGYNSTLLAEEMKNNAPWLKLKMVQHHKAHIASCIIDNNIKGKAIGVAFDGTGLGLDGNIWGGEFFVGDIRDLKRAAHLKYVPMPGGEASIKGPWRMAVSYLYSVYGRDSFDSLRLDFIKRLNRDDLMFLKQILDKNLYSPKTSSMGRLFDAVSALVGGCSVAEYEGQAAVALEKAIINNVNKRKTSMHYRFAYRKEEQLLIIDPAILIKGVVDDLKRGFPAGIISFKFHNAVCNMVKDVCRFLRARYGIRKVCLSGGVFQNRYLSDNIKNLLSEEGFIVHLHNKIPCHDGNIALGQAILAGV